METNLDDVLRLLRYCKDNNISHVRWGSLEAVFAVGSAQAAPIVTEKTPLTDEEILTGYREDK